MTRSSLPLTGSPIPSSLLQISKHSLRRPSRTNTPPPMSAPASLCSPLTGSGHIRLSARTPFLSGASRRLGVSALVARPSLYSSLRGSAGSLPAGRLSVRCSGVATVGESEFSVEVLESGVPVMVEFFAEWCGPCRLITPFIEWASQEYEGRLKVVKIDHDANPELIKEYKVYGLPALILFKNGQEVPGSRKEGAITKVKLKEYLDSLLESTTTVV